MRSKFNQAINSLTQNQIAFARLVEANGLDSYSQAVKALANEDIGRVAGWKTALDALDAEGKLVQAKRY